MSQYHAIAVLTRGRELLDALIALHNDMYGKTDPVAEAELLAGIEQVAVACSTLAKSIDCVAERTRHGTPHNVLRVARGGDYKLSRSRPN